MYASSLAYTMSVSNVIVTPLVPNSSYTTKENLALTVANPGVLTNALDVLGTNLTAALLAGRTNGTLSLSTNGGFTYMPTNGFYGTDGFTFQASDKLKNLGTASVNITVLQLTNTLIVTVNNTNRAYGSTNPVFTVSYSGFVSGDTSGILTGAPAFTTTATTNSPVGTNSISVSQGTLGTSNNNYLFAFTNGTLTVNPATLTVTAGSTNRLYGATNPVFTVSYSGFVNSDTTGVLSGAPSLATSAKTNSPAGGYTITNSPGTLSATNYAFSFTNGTLTVTPVTLTVTANNTNRSYGATNPVFTASYAGFVNGDTTSALSGTPSLITSATTSSPAGVYVITNTAGTLSATNYSFNFANGTLTVGTAVLAVTANNTNRIYGATNPVFTVTYNGFLNGDNASVLSGAPVLTTSATTNSPKGSYIITNTIGSLSATNYSFSFTNGILTINPAALTVTASNRSKAYGQTAVFAGTEFSTSGLLNSDTATGAAMSSTGAAAGAGVNGSPYSIVVTNATGTGLTNYTISYVNGQLAVTPATLTVTASNTNRPYGAANPAFTAIYTGFLNGDTAAVLSGTPGLATAATAASPLGNYTITATNGTLSAANYSFNFANGTLTVGTAVLAVTANNTNRIYGATNPVFTVTYNGFLNGDNASVLSGAPVLTTGATTNSPKGSYIITNTIGSLSATNYSFSFTNGILTINPAALTVTASNRNKAYGQTAVFAGTEFSTSGLLNSDTATGAAMSSTGAAAGAGVNGSPYSIVVTNATGTGLTNYTISYVNGQLAVTPATLTVTASNTTGYGAANPAFTAIYTGFLNGDTAAVLSGTPGLATAATAASPLGNYTITATNCILSAANYNFNFCERTVVGDAGNIDRDGQHHQPDLWRTNPVFTVTYSGFVNGDNAGV